MQAVIIDNESPIREGLKELLSIFCPEIQVVAEADGVRTGILAIRDHSPDIVFLDVEMDDGTGLDLVKAIPTRDFQLIFITAHNKYAVKAIRLSALDYLLKPVDPEELVAAVEKAKNAHERSSISQKLAALADNLNEIGKQEKKIVLKGADSIHVIPVTDIARCEAEGSYTRFFVDGGRQILVSGNLKEYEQTLVHYGFFRCHHSHLVNVHAISRMDKADGGMLVFGDGSKVPVASRKREAVVGLLSGL